MKRLTARIVISLLTIIAGVCIAGSLLYQPPPAASPTPAPAASPQQTDEPSESLEAAYIEGDKLSYAGYDVERSFDTAEKQSSARIKKDGRTLDTVCCGGLEKVTTRFGLFPFLGKKTKQLVIMQYSGGAHCCWSYKIYELSPSLRTLFNGKQYEEYVGYELSPEDIDGDGRLEFVQAVMAFDYFHMSHATSVFPSVVFAYDEKRGGYVPANRKFSAYLLDGIEEDVQKALAKMTQADTQNVNGREKYLSAVLGVMLKYMYAGQEQEAWDFFLQHYTLSDKAEIIEDIRRKLGEDLIYQSIYR
jgi:hypothetical protein